MTELGGSMNIPEAMEHKYNCDDTKTPELCDAHPDCKGCPYDGCAPYCPQCVNERWAKWVLSDNPYSRWIVFEKEVVCQFAISRAEFEALKKLAGEAV